MRGRSRICSPYGRKWKKWRPQLASDYVTSFGMPIWRSIVHCGSAREAKACGSRWSGWCRHFLVASRSIGARGLGDRGRRRHGRRSASRFRTERGAFDFRVVLSERRDTADRPSGKCRYAYPTKGCGPDHRRVPILPDAAETANGKRVELNALICCPRCL